MSEHMTKKRGSESPITRGKQAVQRVRFSTQIIDIGWTGQLSHLSHHRRLGTPHTRHYVTKLPTPLTVDHYMFCFTCSSRMQRSTKYPCCRLLHKHVHTERHIVKLATRHQSERYITISPLLPPKANWRVFGSCESRARLWRGGSASSLRMREARRPIAARGTARAPNNVATVSLRGRDGLATCSSVTTVTDAACAAETL